MPNPMTPEEWAQSQREQGAQNAAYFDAVKSRKPGNKTTKRTNLRDRSGLNDVMVDQGNAMRDPSGKVRKRGVYAAGGIDFGSAFGIPRPSTQGPMTARQPATRYAGPINSPMSDYLNGGTNGFRPSVMSPVVNGVAVVKRSAAPVAAPVTMRPTLRKYVDPNTGEIYLA